MKKAAPPVFAIILAIAGFVCRGGRPNLAPRPEPLGFPLKEAGSLPFAGTANGPVRARYGTAYFTTAEGSVYGVDVPSRRIVWKFDVGRPVPAAPELGEDSLLVRDADHTIHVLDLDGRLIFKVPSPEPITTAVREIGGRIYHGCGNGRIRALDALKNGQTIWEFDAGAAVSAGPAFSGGLVFFGTETGRLIALDDGGRPRWTFAAKGAIMVDPAAGDGRVYFGTAERTFYALAADSGKRKWQFRLAGAPLHPPAIAGKRLVFAASDSVVYCLQAGSGQILWWQPVPARVVHGPSIADGIVLVSALSPELAGYDLRGGYSVGKSSASAEILAGALWATPYVVAIEPGSSTADERVVFFERDRRPVLTLGEKNPVRR